METNNEALMDKIRLYEEALIQIGLIVQQTNLYEQTNYPFLNSRLKIVNKLSKIVLNPSREYLTEAKNDMWFIRDVDIKSKFNILKFLKRGVL